MINVYLDCIVNLNVNFSFSFQGNCAYFNTYGEGNIDGRPCISSPNLICPNAQYSSAENTNCE